MIWKVQIIILSAVFSLSAYDADADVYRYTADDGSVCYTDIPGRKNAVLVLRESRPVGKKGRTPLRNYLTSRPRTAPANPGLSRLQRSCLPVNGVVTSAPGLRTDPFTGELKNHNGIDIAIAEGTSVRAISPGVVTYSGIRNGYGNIIIVDHENGLVTLYAHNSQNLVSSGDKIGSNTVIALTGSTGRSTGPHLHFEAWRMGENVTAEYLPGSWGSRSFVKMPAARRKSLAVRKVVMDDGTIVLTNLPLVHP